MGWVINKNDNKFDPAPEGLQQAVCVDVHDLGIVQTSFGMKPQVLVVWMSEYVDEKTGKHLRV
jgi:hypothetical protein